MSIKENICSDTFHETFSAPNNDSIYAKKIFHFQHTNPLFLSKFTKKQDMSPELLEELIEQSTNWGGVEQNWLKPTILNLSNIDFWAYVVHHFDQIRVEQDILRYLVSLGIPGPLRGLLWQLFTHSKEQVNEKKYRQLVKLSSPHEKWIQRDLSRTFPKLDYFKERKGRDLLYNVIKAYSICDEQVGYCQGIHFIVGCLLLHMSDEAAFCVLVKLMNQYGLRGYFAPKMEALHERMYQFDQLLLLHLPQVHRHLDAQGIKSSMYVSQWILTLFAYRCPLHLVYRVFDLVLLEGAHMILHFSLALMKKNQKTILGLEFESLLKFFASGIFDVYEEDAFGFVQDACSFDIPPRLLNKLSKQYSTEAAKQAKIQQSQDAFKRENLALHDQVKRLQGSYKQLELEHQEVSSQVIDTKMKMASMAEENQFLRHELALAKNKADEREHTWCKENRALMDQNDTLQSRLRDLESVLIEYKVKYAECNDNYEIIQEKLFQVQKSI